MKEGNPRKAGMTEKGSEAGKESHRKMHFAKLTTT